MEYGCIGEKLGHSFSKEIHSALSEYKYELKEIPRDGLDSFMRKKDFKAINVTIPYKEAVIPYLYEIEDTAAEIGAVNTVVNRNGRLYGYNTDFYGMTRLIAHANIDVREKRVAILGSGGTSKTARAVAGRLGADEIIRVSRNGRNGAVTYEELYEKHPDIQIIINTTPIGMFPDVFESPVDLSRFPSLVGVIDAVYNPLRTRLVLEAAGKNISSEGGLYMLTAQAVRASEIFLGTHYSESECDRVFNEMSKAKENIVLIGMPSSGKSTVGRLLADKLGRKFYDTDTLAEERIGMSISEYFLKFGEATFRTEEQEAVRDVCKNTCSVISTGGGAVLRSENVRNLKKNGKLFFIDRPLEALMPSEDRPLASNRRAITQRYEERYEIYKAAADVVIPAECEVDEVAERILKNR